MEFLKMALNADFLLFILGIFWMDVSGYIQKKIATCNRKAFALVAAVFTYMIVITFFSREL